MTTDASGPFMNEVTRPKDKIIKQYIVTYEQHDRGVKKTTVTRQYYSNDYQDSMSSEFLPLRSVK